MSARWVPCAGCPRPHDCPSRKNKGLCKRLASDRGRWLATVLRLPGVKFVYPSGARVIDERTYVTTAQLTRDTLSLAGELPADLDLVVAIARSGLVPGGLIAYHRHLKLLTVSRQRGLQHPGNGVRLEGTVPGEYQPPETPRHILIVDDTAARGREMLAAAQVVREQYPDSRITRCVVYAHPEGLHAVDRYWAVYPGPHYLEWNWANAGHGALCAFDFDGIFCRDFTAEECRTLDSYRAAMATITPLHLPRRLPVPLIVTARLESTRDLTEAWLTRHGVRWQRLVMWPGEAHPPASEVAPWKARYYREAAGINLFAESDPEQAHVIADLSGKPVLCPAAGRLITPKQTRATRPAPARRPELLREIRVHRFAATCPYRSKVGCGCSQVRCNRPGSEGRMAASDCTACARRTLLYSLPSPSAAAREASWTSRTEEPRSPAPTEMAGSRCGPPSTGGPGRPGSAPAR